MNDLIYRQDAIDVIDRILPVNPTKNDYTQGIAVGAALAIQYVKELPSAQMRWVLRSEKLPEERTKVLATVLVPHRESIVISAEYLMSTFYCDNGDCWMADDEEVVAWMPLPQPWEGRQDG